MTADEALAKLAAARLRLFNAAQQREAVVLRRVRMDDQKGFDALNVEISDARADVDAATADARKAIDAEQPPDTGPPDTGKPTPRDIALDAVMTARAALAKLEK